MLYARGDTTTPGLHITLCQGRYGRPGLSYSMPGAIRPHLVFSCSMPGAIRPHLIFSCSIMPYMSYRVILCHITSYWGLMDHPIFIHINNILCNASYSWILMQQPINMAIVMHEHAQKFICFKIKELCSTHLWLTLKQLTHCWSPRFLGSDPTHVDSNEGPNKH